MLGMASAPTYRPKSHTHSDRPKLQYCSRSLLASAQIISTLQNRVGHLQTREVYLQKRKYCRGARPDRVEAVEGAGAVAHTGRYSLLGPGGAANGLLVGKGGVS